MNSNELIPLPAEPSSSSTSSEVSPTSPHVPPTTLDPTETNAKPLRSILIQPSNPSPPTPGSLSLSNLSPSPPSSPSSSSSSSTSIPPLDPSQRERGTDHQVRFQFDAENSDSFEEADRSPGTRKGGFLHFSYPRCDELEQANVPKYYRYMRQHEPRLEDIRLRQEEDTPADELSGARPPSCQSRLRCSPESTFQLLTAAFMLRVFSKALFSWTVVVSSVVAGLAAWGAHSLGLATDMPITLYSSAIIFPLSFGINAAYSRRDRVLLDMASLRSNIFELYILARNWTRSRPELDIHLRVKRTCVKTLQSMEQLLTHHGDPKVLFKIYRDLDRLATLYEELRQVDAPMNGVISRAYQYLRFLRLDFERIRTVYEFRTAAEIRAYALIGISTLGVLWSPYFAHLANGSTGIWAAVYAIVLTNIVLSTLFEVYSGLEDPFDSKGDDDLNFAWCFEVNNYLFEDVATTSYVEQVRPLYPRRRRVLGVSTTSF